MHSVLFNVKKHFFQNQVTHLTSSHIRALEVGVQQQVEVEGDVLVGVVDADVQVQFFLSENQSEENDHV
jgi:hypothetical protein